MRDTDWTIPELGKSNRPKWQQATKRKNSCFIWQAFRMMKIYLKWRSLIQSSEIIEIYTTFANVRGVVDLLIPGRENQK